MTKLTVDRLMEVLSYDPETGVWMWRTSTSGHRRGAVAGTVNAKGYRLISIDGVKYYEHRLAHLYMTGEWPPSQMDHREHRAFGDNRWRNLRPATPSQNGANQGKPKNNTSGWKGVIWEKRRHKWRAQMQADGRIQHLGYFDCPAAAAFAYQLGADKMFGEFARAS